MDKKVFFYDCAGQFAAVQDNIAYREDEIAVFAYSEVYGGREKLKIYLDA